jgi:hypothetical protein
VPRIANVERLNTLDASRHTTDGLRLHRLSTELEQQPSRERRRREDAIREEFHDSRATTITAATQEPGPPNPILPPTPRREH